MMHNVIQQQKDITQYEINELRDWFDIDYTRREQKLRRLIMLNKMCDNGANPNTELLNLYAEAEIKRAKIKTLKAFNNKLIIQ